jgi:hypothetical protein
MRRAICEDFLQCPIYVQYTYGYMRGPARPYVHTSSMFMRVFETPVDTYGRFFVLAHDDAGVGAAKEGATVNRISYSHVWRSHTDWISGACSDDQQKLFIGLAVPVVNKICCCDDACAVSSGSRVVGHDPVAACRKCCIGPVYGRRFRKRASTSFGGGCEKNSRCIGRSRH